MISSAPAPLCGAGVKQWSQRDIAELMDLPLPLSPPSLFMCGGIHRDPMAPTERDATSLKQAQEIKSEIRNAPAELAGKQFRRGGLNQRFFSFYYLFLKCHNGATVCLFAILMQLWFWGRVLLAAIHGPGTGGRDRVGWGGILLNLWENNSKLIKLDSAFFLSKC